MFFHSWIGLVRTLIVGMLAYVGLVFMLRVSGKRTLSKMNAFDLVVTVALGSTLATILLSPNVPLAEGLMGFLVLIALQYVVAWLSVRSHRFQQLVKARPTLLFYEGEFLHEALLKERVAEDEVRSAVRSQGLVSLDVVAAVVLETDGTFTALQKADSARQSALEGVRNFGKGRKA